MADRQSLSPAILVTLAWRNLWRNYRRTLIMLAAIVLGVWAMILFSALMRGMLDEMVAGGLRVLPGEVQIHHPQYRDDPSVVNSMAPPEGKLLDRLNSSSSRSLHTTWSCPVSSIRTTGRSESE